MIMASRGGAANYGAVVELSGTGSTGTIGDVQPQSLRPLTGKTPRERITEAYRNAGFNGHSFSQRIGVAYKTVHSWKQPDGNNPSRENLKKAAEATGYSVDEIMGTKAEEPPYPAWQQFLTWLKSAPDRSRLEPWMLDEIRRFRGRPGREPNLESYQRLYFAILTFDEPPAGTEPDE